MNTTIKTPKERKRKKKRGKQKLWTCIWVCICVHAREYVKACMCLYACILAVTNVHAYVYVGEKVCDCLSELPMEASVFAMARWLSGNQRAASLVGTNMIKGWPHAARNWPRSRTGYKELSGNIFNVVMLLSKAPVKFSHDAKIIWKRERKWRMR